MKRALYTLYDVKTHFYHPPVCVINENDAKRTFQTMLNGKVTLFSSYPEDYHVYFLGNYDDHDGTITPSVPPVYVCGLDELQGKKTLCESQDG